MAIQNYDTISARGLFFQSAQPQQSLIFMDYNTVVSYLNGIAYLRRSWYHELFKTTKDLFLPFT